MSEVQAEILLTRSTDTAVYFSMKVENSQTRLGLSLGNNAELLEQAITSQQKINVINQAMILTYDSPTKTTSKWVVESFSVSGTPESQMTWMFDLMSAESFENGTKAEIVPMVVKGSFPVSCSCDGGVCCSDNDWCKENLSFLCEQ